MFGIKIKFERNRDDAQNQDSVSGQVRRSVEPRRKEEIGAENEKILDMTDAKSGSVEARKKVIFSDIAHIVPRPADSSTVSGRVSSASAAEISEEAKENKKEDKEDIIEQKKLGWAWDAIVRWALYALIFLTPIFFLPWGNSPVVQNKQFLATVLVVIAFIAWLAKTIVSGKLVWPKAPINIAVWFLIVVWAASSLFSMSKYRSVGLVGLEADSLLNMIKYVLAFFLVAAGLREAKNAERRRNSLATAAYIFLASVVILIVFTGLKLANINFLPWDFTRAIDFNTVGTIYALALFLGAGLILTVGLAVGDDSGVFVAAEGERRAWVRRGAIVLAIVLVIELVLINFNLAWWPLAGAMLFFVARLFAREAQETKSGQKSALRIQKFIFPLLILGISVLLLLVRIPAFFQLSQEVRPTNRATYEISKNVLASKGFSTELFGSGPGTFTFDYGLYRGPLNNQNPLENIFWGVRFNQGFSFVSTALATTGILGILAIVLLIFAFLWQIVSRSNVSGETIGNHGVFQTTFIPMVIYFFIAWFLYPANFSLLMFSFVAMGLLMAANDDRSGRFGELARGDKEGLRQISLLASPQRTMVISLLLIVLMIGSVSLLYVASQKYIASLYFSSGLNVFNNSQNPDVALTKIGKAINLDSVVDDYQRAASQLFLVKTKKSLDDLQVASGATAESLRAEFQNNMARAVSFAQQAQLLNPNESVNWTNLGYVYENVLLFVDGAEDWMITAYEKATTLEPQNPSLWTDLGRAYLAVADKAQTQIDQFSSGEKPDQGKIDALKQRWGEAIAKAIEMLDKAVGVKPDYSPAHLLLAQAYSRQGDIKNAIKKSADYYALNSSDAGAAFQLGFLFYKDNQMENAKMALERAVELNDNYSNARYFLGLIYDAQGNKQAAKEQFEKIAAVNPDNAEVKKILDNLNAGRGALETIVPPAAPPGQRTQVPVPETGGAGEGTIKH